MRVDRLSVGARCDGLPCIAGPLSQLPWCWPLYRILHKKFLHHRLHRRAGRTTAMTTVLYDARDRDSRMLDWGERHEPCMVAIFLRSFVFFNTDALCFLDYLSRPGFPCYDHIVEPSSMSGTVGRIDHAHHSSANLLEHRRIDMDAAPDYRGEDLHRRPVD